MDTKVAIKLVALLTALTATITAIFLLKQGHMKAFWTSLGFDNGGTRINWCLERVDSLYFYDSKEKLIEKDGQWLWVAETEKPLDYLRVEKWFAKYCQVPVETDIESAVSAARPVFEASFIDGQRLTLSAGADNLFQLRDQVFVSETLRKAIEELLAFGEKIE